MLPENLLEFKNTLENTPENELGSNERELLENINSMDKIIDKIITEDPDNPIIKPPILEITSREGDTKRIDLGITVKEGDTIETTKEDDTDEI